MSQLDIDPRWLVSTGFRPASGRQVAGRYRGCAERSRHPYGAWWTAAGDDGEQHAGEGDKAEANVLVSASNQRPHAEERRSADWSLGFRKRGRAARRLEG